MREKKRVVAVDGTSLAYRAFYALPKLSTASGRPTGATLGFLNMILRLLEDYQPFTIVVAFDHPRKTFRHILEERYKVSRKPMPDMLRPQLADIKEILRFLGFPVLEVPGFEGDDIIGSLKERLSEEHELFVVTSDLDLLQLLDSRTVLLQPVQGVTHLRIIRDADLERELGITPSQVIDFLALSGDASDNIPGIRGIGEKRAALLLRRFGSLEGIFAHIDELSPALQEVLLASRERITMNRILATIRRDIPLECPMEPWSFAQVQWSALFQKLDELELRRLRERVERKWYNRVFMLQGRDLVTLDGNELPQKGAKYLFSVIAPDPEYLEMVLRSPETFWGPVLLFISYPVLFPFSQVLESIRGGRIPQEAFMLLDEACAWLKEQPLLALAYLEVEVPLVRDVLLRKVALCDKSFPELPLFGPPVSLLVRCVPPRDLQRTKKKSTHIALPTLYGWRFIGEENDAEDDIFDRYKRVLEEEVFHLLVRAFQKRGVCRFHFGDGEFFAEAYGIMESLGDVIVDAFGMFSRDRWQVEWRRETSSRYELLLVGEGG
ncbi:5'-3' exonuclease H3TH domain-containing protein [Candidatus Caldatribacterium sp.]|uniref:5'-3' exonuclease n=1 Tax=Candidatus Caldatribacterium sp. TaxID=2282143 RepID=UPI002995AC05|nr:5'-3' exonuclease [Candidatus Caldatribacterium sp.]MDW8080885.1 5'-3' exonuclease [Candidatus Calescibacterium sp.]